MELPEIGVKKFALPRLNNFCASYKFRSIFRMPNVKSVIKLYSKIKWWSTPFMKRFNFLRKILPSESHCFSRSQGRAMAHGSDTRSFACPITCSWSLGPQTRRDGNMAASQECELNQKWAIQKWVWGKLCPFRSLQPLSNRSQRGGESSSSIKTLTSMSQAK